MRLVRPLQHCRRHEPAQLLGITNHRLDIGCPANLVLFDLPGPETTRLTIRKVINQGQLKST